MWGLSVRRWEAEVSMYDQPETGRLAQPPLLRSACYNMPPDKQQLIHCDQRPALTEGGVSP